MNSRSIENKRYSCIHIRMPKGLPNKVFSFAFENSTYGGPLQFLGRATAMGSLPNKALHGTHPPSLCLTMMGQRLGP